MNEEDNKMTEERGHSYYCWDSGKPQRTDDVIRLAGEHQCFITGETINESDDAHWTDEFDAWVSCRGYQMIQDAHSMGGLENNKEWEIIFAEWYAKDEAEAGRNE
tara:strand:+ start:144 stop:458 length:315 start_codon:yes stop_codon:yes gene_type:complete